MTKDTFEAHIPLNELQISFAHPGSDHFDEHFSVEWLGNRAVVIDLESRSRQLKGPSWLYFLVDGESGCPDCKLSVSKDLRAGRVVWLLNLHGERGLLQFPLAVSTIDVQRTNSGRNSH